MDLDCFIAKVEDTKNCEILRHIITYHVIKTIYIIIDFLLFLNVQSLLQNKNITYVDYDTIQKNDMMKHIKLINKIDECKYYQLSFYIKLKLKK